MSNHEIEFFPSGRGKAQCEADPNYPNGKDVETGIIPNCFVKLPYPAPECGYFLVKCKICRTSLMVTAAGRADDPISVTVPCNVEVIQAS